MPNITTLAIIQKYIVLATGAPGSNIVRNEVIRLFEQTNDLSQVDELVDTFMFQQAQANEKGMIGVIQDTAYNGFGLNFSDEETQQLITDLVAQGIDSWSKLFAFATTAVHENLSTILDNRSEAANRFTDLLAELNKDSDYDGSQAINAAHEWIAGIGASNTTVEAASNSAKDLISNFFDGNVQGRAFDGYISGATVFIDTNQDGVLTPGEISTTTDALGHFMFEGDLLDGNLIVTGGTDIATNLPFTSTLSTPQGAFTLSPLSTLVNQLLQNNQVDNIVMAEDILFQSLDVPRVDLSFFDPISVGLNPDTSVKEQNTALQLQATTAQISNLLLVSSTLIDNIAGDNIAGDTMQSMTSSLLDAVTTTAQNNKVIDLTEPQTLQDIITAGAAISGLVDNTDTPANQIATVLAEINTIMQRSAENNNNANAQTTFSNIIKLQTAAQAQVIPAVVTALETGDLSTVVTEFTDNKLINHIDKVNPTGTLNENTPVNDGNELTNNPAPPPTTPPSVEATAPTLSSSTPADDATAVAVDSNVVLTFNETVVAGAGNIVISDGTDTRTIDVTDGTQVSFSGSNVTINPTTDLNPNTTYNVQMTSGVINDTVSNAYAGIGDSTTLNFTTPDTLAPTLSSSTPADDATAVAVGSNVVITFNETVVAGVGNIVISDGTDTRTIDVTDGTQVSFSGSNVTINPTTDLNPNTTYNVQMTSGVINDAVGNAYAGIGDSTTLNFTTPDTLAPTLSSSTPADDATAVAVGSNVVITFNETVVAGAGNIIISDGTDTRTIDVTDATQVSFSGNSVTINPTTDLNPNTTYNVQMASGVINDAAGNAYAGIGDSTTLNFTTTDTLNPTLVSSTPADDATNVAVDSNIVLTFSEAVIAGTGNIVISDGTDTRTIAITDDTQVNFNGSSVTINPTADLNADTIYNVQMISGVITDTAGNTYMGISNTTTLNFSTPDTNAPILDSSTPADDATAVAVGSDVVLTFSETIIAGMGNIVISDGNGDTRTIAITDGTQISFSGSSVTIDPTADLNINATYNVQMASGVIEDSSGNAFAGISDTTTLNFTTTTLIELSAIEQSNNNDGFVINGVSTGDQSGISVSSAGDVNNDGLADLIVGANYDDPNGSNSGASFVVFGKTNGSAVELSDIDAGNDGFVINGVSGDDQSGRSVSSAGDVNGDGLIDLIVGAYFDDPNGSASGSSFVVFGKTNGTVVELSDIEAGNDGFVINGVSANDQSGHSVSSAGDVNGDGLADLIIGARYDDPNGASSGASFVVFGKTSGTTVELSDIENGSGGFVINGVSIGDQSGRSVSGAGDVNGDGLADLVVGASGDDPNGAGSGASFVIFGKTNGTAVELSDTENGNNGFVINGVSASDYSGISVSGAGDVNGDGFSDLIVGALLDDPNGSLSGASFVVFGKTNGNVVELSDVESGNGGFVINGVSASDNSGLSVSSAGDVNGDGLTDLIVGASGDDPNGASSGASFVVFGKTNGNVVELSDVESGNGGFVINGVSNNDNSGLSVSSAGDVNGDGFADLIIGAFLDDPNGNSSGASFVVFGGQGTSATVGTSGNDTLTGNNNANQLVAGAGDDILIGNGGADVLRGGSGNDILAVSDLTFSALNGGTGTDTLRFDTLLKADLSSITNSRISNLEIIDLNNTGSHLALSTDDILTIVGNEASNDLQINGSNLDSLDLSSTAFFNSATTETIDSITYDIYKPSTSLNLDESVRLLVQQKISMLGARNAPIELSAVEQKSNNSGFVINGVSAGDQSGASVSNAGDVNGDGLADLIVGAAYDDPNKASSSGASFVVFGKTNGTAVELSNIEVGKGGFVINGVNADDQSGHSVSNAGDVNGDGYSDVIVGAHFDDPNGNASGASFVVFGKTNSTTIELSNIEAGKGGFVIDGANTFDLSGFSVSSAGDVNNDGLADLIVGAPFHGPNGPASGASFVIFGKTNSTAVELSNIEKSSGGFVINGVSTSDESGHSVSNAGDVNGDGLADLIVGARSDAPNGNYSGASFVVFGKTNSTTVELSNIEKIEKESGGFVINGVSKGDQSGASVSNAGDVNGDGLADLIVGAAYDDTNGASSGASFVVFGKTDGSIVELSNIKIGKGGFVINGISKGDQSGFSVNGGGDVNGDGFDDLIIGALNDDPFGNNSGASFVVFGKTDGTTVELSNIENGSGGFVINGVSADDQSGVSVSNAGDVNGDGFADLIVGAHHDDPNGADSGATFVIFGGQDTSATVGTSGNDTLTGDNNANQLVAGTGDDILISKGGADILRGGLGDDILAVSDLTFASLDGGTGSDTLRFDAPLNLDFRTLPDPKLDSIEIIDLTNDGGNSTLSLNITDVLNLNKAQTATDTLVIHGSAGDIVNLDNSSNGQTGTWADAGAGVYEFSVGGIGVIGTVTIDATISVNII